MMYKITCRLGTTTAIVLARTADHIGEPAHAVNRNLIEILLSLLCFHLSRGQTDSSKEKCTSVYPLKIESLR